MCLLREKNTLRHASPIFPYFHKTIDTAPATEVCSLFAEALAGVEHRQDAVGVIRYVYAALLFKAKVPPKAQCQCSSVSTKEPRNVTLGFVTAPRSLSRRTRGRLPAPATS